ncbi:MULTISPECIES: polysaccharide biosynthesis/export family protein [unclassified Neptuniibacter]|uniref:polysaccharide biosynthesis/export family protein n=1 Tax=unclassified Neptuniibacter TaxID=2630693 RepID=UPI000C62A7F1|nr:MULTISPECIES: polysaccharide biosynthesis/export family protein [unclassified Neptuniibacter]MAY43406.1 capsular biosynthesis protein [Oceanospirillaceae bacterium]|tara:strand:+ start:6952 stop:7497 length:546 start_codon:yes stop_codon:yes gene_type:complete
MIGSFIRSLFIAVFVLLSFSVSAEKQVGLSDYPLGAGDLLRITVFGEDDLSVEVRLSDAGTISYPFLGELRTRGLTTGVLSESIRSQLADGYLVNPSVSVEVVEYRQFFIYGQVEEPGGYPYQPGLTLQRAVALAGGFSERASSDEFFVASEGQEEQSPVKVGINATIKPGDTVTIEESFF